MIRALRLRPAAIDTLGIFSVSGEMVPTNQNLKNKIAGFLSLLLPDWSIFLNSQWKREKLRGRRRTPKSYFFKFWFVGTISSETDNILGPN